MKTYDVLKDHDPCLETAPCLSNRSEWIATYRTLDTWHRSQKFQNVFWLLGVLYTFKLQTRDSMKAFDQAIYLGLGREYLTNIIWVNLGISVKVQPSVLCITRGC